MTTNDVVNQEVLHQLIVIVLCAGVFAYPFYRMDRYVRSNGYQSPFRSTAFTIMYLLSFIAGWVVHAVDPASCMNCSAMSHPEHYQESLIWPHTVRFLQNYLPTSLALVAGSAAVAYLMPIRRRRFGARQSRIPWRLLSRLSVVVWGVATVASFVYEAEASDQFKLGVICWSLYGTFAYYAQRLDAPSMSRVLSEDARAPVLYLRPFDQEDDVFAAVSTDQLGDLQIPVRNPRAYRHGVTVEEYFATSIQRKIGPFIALGDPQDSIPPGGAAREYCDDESWQTRFRELAARSAFVIMRPGHSDNLRLELSHIRDAGLHPKLLIVIPPRRTWFEKVGGDRLGVLFDSTVKDWGTLMLVANSVGLSLSEFPGYGSVVSFDRDGKMLTLKTGLTKPNEYVTAICAHVAEEDRSESRHS